jgi:hypothetical protein
MTLRQRIEQRITDLRAERGIAAAATPGPWRLGVLNSEIDDPYGDLVCQAVFTPDQHHIAIQDPATTIARIDRELAGCHDDLALLDRCDYLAERGDTGGVPMALANLNTRYPKEDA